MLASIVVVAQLAASAVVTPIPGLDQRALEALVQRAGDDKSDALVILKDGKLVGEWYFGQQPRRIHAMSVTKSIVALAVGRLVTTGKLSTVDTPVHAFFPEWKQGRKEKITVKHLLQMTSGLQTLDGTKEIYPQKDFVQLALAAELSDEPGARFRYNNKAVNLLGAIVERVAGKRLDAYLRDEIFAPLGITDVAWDTDPAGTPQSMSGCQLRATDLAKLAQLMLDGGTWKGKQLLAPEWVRAALTPAMPNAPYGYLWWLIVDAKLTIDDETLSVLKQGGAPADLLAAVAPLKGKSYGRADWFASLERALGGKAGLERWYDATWRKGLPDGKLVDQRVVGFRGDGWLGQQVVVLVPERLVVVRMHAQREAGDDAENKRYGMSDLTKLVRALIPPTVGSRWDGSAAGRAAGITD